MCSYHPSDIEVRIVYNFTLRVQAAMGVISMTQSRPRRLRTRSANLRPERSITKTVTNARK